MSVDLKNLDLKAINAYKKKVTWGDVPTIYHMLSGSIGELDGILSHGFSNPFKDLLNKNKWNLTLLKGRTDKNGLITTEIKPQIVLKHHFFESHYELLCFPVVNGEICHKDLIDDPDSPFTRWYQKVSGKLFRINSLIPFISYSFNKGDEADMLLTRFAYIRVEELINTLRESFDIIEIKGDNIAEFCKKLIVRRKELLDEGQQQSSSAQQNALINELINNQDEKLE